MGGARLWAASIRRHRRVASILLVVVVGLAGGVVMTTVEVARRTETTLDRYLAQPSLTSHVVIACPEGVSEDGISDPGMTCGTVANVEQVTRLVATSPVVERLVPAGVLVSALRAQPTDPWDPTIQFALLDDWPGLSTAPVIVDGRLPGQQSADEMAINESLADKFGVSVGDRMQAATFGTDQRFDAVSGKDTEPAGPNVTMTVVGIVRDTQDLTNDPEPQFFTTAAWWRGYGSDDVASYGKGVAIQLTDPADLNGLKDALTEVLPDRFFDVSFNLQGAETFERVVELQALAVWAVALVSLIASLGFVGQLIARQVTRDLADRDALAALGMTRRDLVMSSLLRIGPAALAAGVIAAAVAVVASPVGPVGVARQLEIDPGVDIDLYVLAIGTILVIGFVFLATALSSVLATRVIEQSRGATVAIPGNPPVGVRAGLSFLGQDERRTALGAVIGTAVAIAFVVLALSLRTSYDDLLDHPDRFGQNWDVALGDFGSPDEVAEGTAMVERTSGIAGVGTVLATEAGIVGTTPVFVFAFVDPDGVVGPTILEGRAPTSPDEIALGTTTLADLDLDMGDTVVLTSELTGDDVPFEIVGRSVANDGVDSTIAPGAGGLVTDEAYAGIDPARTGQSLLIAAEAGVTTDDLIERLRENFGGSVVAALVPEDVANLDRVSAAPTLLAAIVSILAVAALISSLLTIIGRRRREIAVLRSLGFVRRQVLGSTVTVALVLATCSVVIGIPLGIVATRWGWAIVQTRLGLESGVVIPPWAVAVAIVGTFMVATVVAVIPGTKASRIPAAEALRTE